MGLFKLSLILMLFDFELGLFKLSLLYALIIYNFFYFPRIFLLKSEYGQVFYSFALIPNFKFLPIRVWRGAAKTYWSGYFAILNCRCIHVFLNSLRVVIFFIELQSSQMPSIGLEE